jgi:hypothetical protein
MTWVMGESKSFTTAIWAKQTKVGGLLYGGLTSCVAFSAHSAMAGITCVLAGAVVVAWAWRRAPKMGAYAEREGVRVVGFLRTRLIPWSNIDHFALIGGTARVFRRTGAPVMVAGLSAGSRWSRRSEAADHVEALNEMLQHHRPMRESSVQATA